MSKLLSIVVPYYNQPENLQDLLDSLHSQSLRQMEIIIVDDCSEKSPGSRTRCRAPRCRP